MDAPTLQRGTSSGIILPVELLLKIFSYLGQYDLCLRVSPVCKQWLQLSRDTTFWTRLVLFRAISERGLLTVRGWATQLSDLDITAIESRVVTRAVMKTVTESGLRVKRLALNFIIPEAAYMFHGSTGTYIVLTNTEHPVEIFYALYKFSPHLTELSVLVPDNDLIYFIRLLRHLNIVRIEEQLERPRVTAELFQKYFEVALHLPILQRLTLANCKNLTADAVHMMAANCTNLRRLTLDACANVTDSLLRIIVEKCTQLEHLRVESSPNVRGTCFANCPPLLPRLRVLSVRGCPVNTAAIAELRARRPGLIVRQ